jgi:acyl-CoA reductase-like NAD-dependent aldehyde dehydrogenase
MRVFYRPTVLKNVPRTSRAFKEEIFAPVAVIVPYKDEEDAIRVANETGFGLAAAVFGELSMPRKSRRGSRRAWSMLTT